VARELGESSEESKRGRSVKERTAEIRPAAEVLKESTVTTEQFLSEEEKSIIQTGAFCAYVMHAENCSQQEAVRRMSKLCSITQIAMGLGDRSVNQRGAP
jgi:hypothetical protein